MSVLAAASVGAQLGMVSADKFKEVFRETYNKAFPDFDIEKVFWQTMYVEGLYLVINVIYRISDVWIGLTANLPYLFGGKPPIIVNTDMPEDQFKQIMEECTEETGYGEGNTVWGACVIRKMEEAGYPVDPPTMIEDLLQKVFVDYAPLVIMGIPLVFVLLEAKNMKNRKKAKKLIGA